MNGGQLGFHLWADVSGYDLSGAAREHSVDARAELLGVVADQTTGVFEASRLETGAIFGRIPPATQCNTLIAVLEAMYFAFATRKPAIGRGECACRGCTAVSDADLEITLDWGRPAPAPTPGSPGHALFTDAAREAMRLNVSAVGLSEWDAYHGGTDARWRWALDLGARWREAQNPGLVYLAADDADDLYRIETSLAPALIWQHLTSSAGIASSPTKCSDATHPRGTVGMGSTVRSPQGRATFDNEMLAWKPYEYFSFRSIDSVLGEFICTDEIRRLGDGRCSVEHRVRGLGGRRQRLRLKRRTREQGSVLPWWLGCY